MSTHKLEMKNISVEFAGVPALRNVDFSMENGHVYALIGANGAGKSTLMKVLSGVNTHYTGEVFLDGQKHQIDSSKTAKEMGIEIVYQEVDVALLPNLSVAENVMLNTIVNKMGKKQLVNWNYIYKKAKEAIDRLGININVRKSVYELTLAEKQMVLIARATMENCKFLILDEPTAPLSNTETENLFSLIRHLVKNEKIGVVFISHRLFELFTICEYISIMRDGIVVHNGFVSPELTVDSIVEHMLGQKQDAVFKKNAKPTNELLFEVKNLTEQKQRVKNINLNVKKGEIVGIVGLVGAGKTELCKTLFGAYSTASGEIWLNEKRIKPKNPTRAVKSGICLVPEERRKEGVLVHDKIYQNLTLPSLHKFLNAIKFVSKKRQFHRSNKLIEEIGIKTSSERQKVINLSGGNQQKVVVGKWLITDCVLYIFDEPTKGVDVAAKKDMFKLIEGLAREGKGIIYASCEFSEIMAIADRVYVMFDGEITKECPVSETNENELLFYSTGGRQN